LTPIQPFFFIDFGKSQADINAGAWDLRNDQKPLTGDVFLKAAT
jgi:hypothetical protein